MFAGCFWWFPSHDHTEETARIDRDYPGGTTFDFAEYEQDTGGEVTTSPTTEGRAAESYYDL